MNCKQCGAAIGNSANFCTFCGAKVEEPIQTATTPPTTGEWHENASTSQSTASQDWVQQPAYPQPTQQHTSYQQNNQQFNASQGAQTMYAHTDQTTTLALVSFILAIISTVTIGWLLIPLAWMIPMTVRTWGIYKGTKPNTTAFGVCTLLFVNLVGGVLLLVADKDN